MQKKLEGDERADGLRRRARRREGGRGARSSPRRLTSYVTGCTTCQPRSLSYYRGNYLLYLDLYQNQIYALSLLSPPLPSSSTLSTWSTKVKVQRNFLYLISLRGLTPLLYHSLPDHRTQWTSSLSSSRHLGSLPRSPRPPSPSLGRGKPQRQPGGSSRTCIRLLPLPRIQLQRLQSRQSSHRQSSAQPPPLPAESDTPRSLLQCKHLLAVKIAQHLDTPLVRKEMGLRWIAAFATGFAPTPATATAGGAAGGAT